jgi:hypothetical protein
LATLVFLIAENVMRKLDGIFTIIAILLAFCHSNIGIILGGSAHSVMIIKEYMLKKISTLNDFD